MIPGAQGVAQHQGALPDLQRGNWHEGWKGYELRHAQNLHLFGGNREHADPFGRAIPRWDGEPTDDRVLIWTEQGFGDQFMFARFIKHVMARAPYTISS